MDKCIVRSIYCGNGKIPKDTVTKKYGRKGTRHECLQRGFGAALKTEALKSLPTTSLQRIKYIGPVFEKNFKKLKIATTTSLIKKMSLLTPPAKKKLLLMVVTRNNKTVDYRAFNSVILFLHDHSVKKLPKCVLVRE